MGKIFDPLNPVPMKDLITLWHQFIDETINSPATEKPYSLDNYYSYCFHTEYITFGLPLPKEVPDFKQALKDLPLALYPDVLDFIKVLHQCHYPQERLHLGDLISPDSTLYNLRAVKDAFYISKDYEGFNHKNYWLYESFVGEFLRHVVPKETAEVILKKYLEEKNFNDFLKRGSRE